MRNFHGTPSAQAIRTHLPGNRQRHSTTPGLLLFIAALGCYGTAFLLTAATSSWAGQLLGSVCIAFFMSWLGVLGHEAGHGSLTARPWLDALLGRVAFLPSLIPYTTWVISHNKLHHAFTNVKGLDPMWAPLTKAEFDALPGWRRVLERCYRTVPGVCLYAIIEIWGRTLLLPSAAVCARTGRPLVGVLDRAAVLATLLAQVAALLAWRFWVQGTVGWALAPAPISLAACVLLPFVQTMWWTGMESFLHHTHPRIRWYADRRERSYFSAQVEATAHIVAPWPLNWLLGGTLEHTAHHAAPGTSFALLPECQRRLEEAFPESVVQEVSLAGCLRTLRVCKLYDYERHQWLDYAGRPSVP